MNEISRTRRLILMALVLTGIVLADQATKEVAIQHLKGKQAITFPSQWAPNDLFRFQYAENPGAFFSLGGRLPEHVRFWVLTGLNTVILGIVSLVLVFKARMAQLMVWALTLILSGGMGNIIDRIFRDGLVVDFMNIGIGRGHWSLRSGIFNIADLAIVGGLLLLILMEIRQGRNAKEAPTAEQG